MRLDEADTGGLGDIGGDITEHTIGEDDTKQEEEPRHGDSGHCYPGSLITADITPHDQPPPARAGAPWSQNWTDNCTMPTLPHLNISR